MLTTKKEKMNTEEEIIENAANKYAEYCNGGSRGGGIIQQSFTAGAKWQQSQSADVAEKKGVKDDLYLYDAIAGDLEEMKSEAECEKYVRDNYMEDGEVHIDIESIIFLKKVGGVCVTETGGTMELNGEEVPNIKVGFEWLEENIEVGDKDEEIKRLRELLNDCINACKYAANNFDAGYELAENVIETTSPVGSLLIAARNAKQALNPKG